MALSLIAVVIVIVTVYLPIVFPRLPKVWLVADLVLLFAALIYAALTLPIGYD